MSDFKSKYKKGEEQFQQNGEIKELMVCFQKEKHKREELLLVLFSWRSDSHTSLTRRERNALEAHSKFR